MEISMGALDRLVKGLLGRPPTAVELNDSNWRRNPELAIVTLWEHGGKQRYEAIQTKEAEIYHTINELNRTITNMREADAAEDKQYLDRIADLTAQLEQAHDQLRQLQDEPLALDAKDQDPAHQPVVVDVAQSSQPKADWLTRLLAKWISRKG